MNRAWAAANALAALLFLYCAAVQINDPDPWLWIPTYVIPAAVCAASVRWHAHPAIPGVVGGMAAFWTFSLWWVGIEESHHMSGFPQFGMLREELVREGLGLGLVAVWMIAIAIYELRRRNLNSS